MPSKVTIRTEIDNLKGGLNEISEFELMCQHLKNTGKSIKESVDDVRADNLEDIFHIDFLSDEYKKFSKYLGVKGWGEDKSDSQTSKE